MWLLTPYFFVSVVLKPDDTKLTVRARVRADLDALRTRYLPELSATISTPRADYQYRATCTHEALAQAMTKIVGDLRHSNVKSEVARIQGLEREQVYARVWGALADGLPPLDKQQDTQGRVVMPRRLRSRPTRSARRR